AYMDEHEGRLPIEDGIDVISVKLTFKRFLQIAKLLDKEVAVVTDNDEDYERNITNKYKDYEGVDSIRIFADDKEALPTLEPQFVDANKDQLEKLCEVIEISSVDFSSQAAISNYMVKNKTKWALKVFDSDKRLGYPDYINNVIAWCDE
ncbi:MAG: hypothetical protein WD449_00340, partial [Candidatus Babeliales bacterium]